MIKYGIRVVMRLTLNNSYCGQKSLLALHIRLIWLTNLDSLCVWRQLAVLS